MDFLSLLLDVVMIGLLLTGIHFALRLTKQLAEMRAGRMEMERFIIEFNSTVNRAEAGIRGLKSAARNSGDDLEKLIEKGQLLRDELHFLTESADQMATRLSESASRATKPAEATPPAKAVQSAPSATTQEKVKAAADKQQALLEEIKGIASRSPTSSAAERDLLRALEKLG